MKKFKYQTSNKDHKKIWICASCKKGQMDAILTGKLRLIDQSSDPEISCDVCRGAETSKNPGYDGVPKSPRKLKLETGRNLKFETNNLKLHFQVDKK